MQNILLIDDDKKLAELLAAYFSDFEIKIQSAVRPSDGLAKLQTGHFDLVILDVMLPEQDGFEVCREIRKQSSIPIMMLTARGDVMDRIVGLELGADDYLPKPFEPRELLARIQRILQRSKSASSESQVLEFDQLQVDKDAMEAKLDGNLLPLSHMEYQLLLLFASSPQKTLSRDEILNHLKGIDTELYSRSVDILISRLRQKLKPLDLIKTVRGRGYVFTGKQT